MKPLPRPPRLVSLDSGSWGVEWRVGGRSRRKSLRTPDQREAEARMAAFLASLGDCEAVQAFESSRAVWSAWILRQARMLARSVGYEGAALDSIKDELRDRLEAQGFRCAFSGVYLSPSAPGNTPLDSQNNRHSKTAVLIRRDCAAPWSIGNWSVVSQIASCILPFGTDKAIDFCRVAARYRLGMRSARNTIRRIGNVGENDSFI